MNCKFILSLLFLSFISANIFATDLKVTNITKTDKNINIEFNNNLTLCNFISDNNSLISPYYENKGTKYYYFHFLNRNFKNDIIEQIKSDTVQFPKNDKNIEYITQITIPGLFIHSKKDSLISCEQSKKLYEK